MVTLLTIKDVYKFYRTPDGTILNVLDGISFDIRAGTITSIIGPSGCGKSTLLRIIAGIEVPSNGNVTYHYGDHKSRPPIPMVLQESALLPWRSVHDNIALSLELLQKHTDAHAIEELIIALGLDGFENALPKELSGGMKARVSIGRALIAASNLVLFDEAFSELDEITRQLINDIFCQHIENSSLSAVVISHDISEAVYLSDRIIILTTRPTKISNIIDITFPRPREPQLRRTADYFDIINTIRSIASAQWK